MAQPERRGRALARLALAAATAAAAGCAGEDPAYLHNREDYQAFRAETRGLLEPNYLPFMAARVALPEPGWRRGLRRLARRAGLAGPGAEALVLCRWADDAFPLAVHVVAPEIPVELNERLFPRTPEAYVVAVERALDLWEKTLEGRVRFTRSPDDGADLRIELLGEPAPLPEPDVQVLGATPLGAACQVEASPDPRRLQVRFRVPTLRVFVADRHGLLLPDQVERIALHEIGHALGMHGHSPIPNDLMFRVVRDRLPRGELGTEDVNSFVTLYSLPNGTVYRRLPVVGHEAAPAPADAAPRLALAPHVNTRLGFEVQLPEGWTSLAMSQGVVAVDGLTWDFVASFQILMRAYPSLDAYLSRYADAHLAGRTLIEEREVRVAGRTALRFVLAFEDGDTVEELTFLDSGDGRVLVAIGEAPAELHDHYGRHFEAILASVELYGRGSGAPDREYGPRPR